MTCRSRFLDLVFAGAILLLVIAAYARPSAYAQMDKPGLLKRVEILEQQLRDGKGVPIGAMLPFFGTRLPNGYAWADGQSTFANADWVPVHLRGAKVPDMREHLVGGAKDGANVGATFRAGTIGGGVVGPAPDRPVVYLTHPDYPEQHVYAFIGEKGAKPVREMWFKDVQRTFARIPYYSVVLPTTKLDSAATNPRHVMCRWIVRME